MHILISNKTILKPFFVRQTVCVLQYFKILIGSMYRIRQKRSSVTIGTKLEAQVIDREMRDLFLY